MKYPKKKRNQLVSGTHLYLILYDRQITIFHFSFIVIHPIYFDEYRLHKHLYYTNGIEWSASAMEMSVIAAKNIANMAYHDWGYHFPSNYNGNAKNHENKEENILVNKLQLEL